MQAAALVIGRIKAVLGLGEYPVNIQ